MLTRTIPRTELDASVICFGGGAVTHSDRAGFAMEQLDLYRDLGGNFIDTANIYGKWLPEATNVSEQYIGAWLKTRNVRNQVVLATKGGHPHLASMTVSRLDRQSLQQDLDESLRSLQTDWIDLYWLHRDDPDLPAGAILDVLESFVRQGKIRHYGCSNWRPERILAARQAADQEGWQGFAANQPRWSLAEANPQGITDPTLVGMDDTAWALHQQAELAAVPYTAQASGYFQKLRDSGKAGMPDGLRRRYDNAINDRRFELISILAGQSGLTLDELVLGYLLAQPFPVFPIIGPRNAEQLKASMKAGSRVWPPALGDWLRRAEPLLDGGADLAVRLGILR
ncbi:MAG: aldo/keto reductase [Clostridiaceae bacterium]|nr:aldo/keto reductase [Clostridiaceae bacterium]